MEQLMLDLIPTGAKAVCHVSQNDIGRTIRFNLTSGNTAYTLAGTETIKVFIKKPDGTTAERNIANTSSTYVDWVTGEGDCDVAGKNECELVITSGTTVIGSKNFTMKVEEDPYNGQGVVIETAGPAPVATFDTNIIDLFVEIKCSVNAIQEGTPWIDSNVIEKEPYNFRKVAGTATRIGNHLFDKLVGGTVAWNQLIANDSSSSTDGTITYTKNSDKSWTITGTYSQRSYKYVTVNSQPIRSKDVVLVSVGVVLPSGITMQFGIDNPQGYDSTIYIPSGTASKVDKISDTGTILTRPFVNINDMEIGDSINITLKPMLINLTQMFGSTIADYIYSLEQATAGAGVAWFRKLFPDDYYAYNAGELISVKTTAHKMVGKNLLPNLQGRRTEYSIFIGQTDGTTYPIFLKGGQPYHLSFSATGTNVGAYYKTATSGNIGIPLNGNLTVDKDMWVQMWLYADNLTSVEWFQLEFGSQATAYEPYTEHNYALDDVELRGLFKLDSNNKLYADGDTYESSGYVTRKFNIINLGSINWIKTDYAEFRSNYASNNIPLPKNRDADTKANALCSRIYDVLTAGQTYRGNNRGIATADNYLSIGDTTYETAEALKTALSDVYFIYEVETPTSETADPFTNPQQVDANGTEEYIDSRTPAIPVGHETYYADIYDISGFTACTINVADGDDVVRQSATIQFGQTVYDGILEYKNGAWTFTGTHAKAYLKDLNWSLNGSFTNTFNGDGLTDRKTNVNWSETDRCNMYVGYTSSEVGTQEHGIAFGMGDDNTRIYVRDIRCSTLAEFVATLTNDNIYIVYELATPFTLTLTGAQLETLLGENRVSHNCNGDTEAKYYYNA